MATYTDVDTDQVRQTAQAISQSIESMKRIINALDNNIMSSLATCWQDDAKDLFSQQFSSFIASFRQLVGEYEALNNELEAAEGTYRQANGLVVSNINKLQ